VLSGVSQIVASGGDEMTADHRCRSPGRRIIIDHHDEDMNWVPPVDARQILRGYFTG
jgi:hypothetical protein